MDTTLTPLDAMTQRNQAITETVANQREGLLRFIRSRVPEPTEAEDILQDVFFEFVNAYRLPQPIEQVGAWLYRVARNRIVDRLRRKGPDHSLSEPVAGLSDDGPTLLEELLPSSEGGPEALFARQRLMEAVLAALEELPEEQREVFIAHELEGRSFKTLADQWGVSLNTLLSRKRYAVLHLRKRLRTIYDEFLDEEV